MPEAPPDSERENAGSGGGESPVSKRTKADPFSEQLDELELLARAIAGVNDTVMITAAGDGGVLDQRIVYVNDAFERRTGYSRAEVLGQTPRILQGPRTQRSELDRIRVALTRVRTVRAELINYKKDGAEYWIELDIVPLAGDGAKVGHFVAVGRGIARRKASENAMENLAFFDALTQLPNRMVLMNRLDVALAGCVHKEDSGALMFIDLDNFKLLNDTRGHDKGDELLQQVAARLTAAVRKKDTVARLGGDEFVVMLKNLGTDPARAADVTKVLAGKILETLGEPYLLAGMEHHSTSSIGITSFSGPEATVGELLKQADLAMYQAKSSGRNTMCFFDPVMQAAVTAHATMTTDLREALRDENFLLHYQPQVNREGRMGGVEALLRWRHPKRGLVLPEEFIPVAEDSGLIMRLGRWVLETACDQLEVWAARPATAHLSMAINVSVRQFRDPDFVDMVLAAIRKRGIDPSRLNLELTETLLSKGMEVSIAKMGTLRDIGVTLALDDFGMGYSSLSALKRIPLDQLKIDKSFVRDILSDPNDAAIARAIIAMAQSLGLGVMAEGVETEAQREFLARQGCHCYQGHLFCPALPLDELEIFMNAQAKAPQEPVHP